MSFVEALVAQARPADISESDDIYAWLIGSWDLDVRYYVYGGEEMKGEVHFARALNGRAIQDVWIMPRIADRPAPQTKIDTWGTTIRVWDPALEAWRVTWINPASGRRDELIGRRCGDEIVQIGTHADGTPIRWKFTSITPDSFHWTGEALQPDGATWKMESEFRGKRRK